MNPDLSYNFYLYSVLLASVVYGLLMHIRLLWAFRRYSAFVLVLLIGASSGLVIISDLNLLIKIFLIFTQIYRIFSYLRVVKDRDNPLALRSKSFRSDVFLNLISVIILVINSWILSKFDAINLLYFLAVLQLVSVAVYYLYFKQSVERTRIQNFKQHIADADLPSITVAIPARNETYDLFDCLSSILNNNYPKMEVLVYDDCSQDNTSDIVKHFAHDGARFIAGAIPPSSWMPKNYAYQKLLDESDGKFVLFCGTDVRFQKDSIRNLIEQLIYSKKLMCSVLPTRNNIDGVHQIIQPMRYWRELVLPYLFQITPPTLSTLWVADKKSLIKYGGFKAFKRSIKPEKHFSKHFNLANQYIFLRSESGLGISSVKGYKAQWNTATRTRYPEMHSRPENVFIHSLWSILIFLMPLPLALICLFKNHLFSMLFALLASILLLRLCYKIDQVCNGNGSWKKVLLFPVSVVSEIITSNYSMWAYEFSQVMWKGRNICLPVLRTIPKLPKIN